MTKKSPLRVPDVRVTVTLFDDEHPALTQALMLTRKGQPRTTRLTSLAYLGLIAEKGGLATHRELVVSTEDHHAESSMAGVAPTLAYESLLADKEVLDLVDGAGTVLETE